MSKNKKFLGLKGREAMVLGINLAMIVLFSILSPAFRSYPTVVSVLDISYYITCLLYTSATHVWRAAYRTH